MKKWVLQECDNLRKHSRNDSSYHDLTCFSISWSLCARVEACRLRPDDLARDEKVGKADSSRDPILWPFLKLFYSSYVNKGDVIFFQKLMTNCWIFLHSWHEARTWHFFQIWTLESEPNLWTDLQLKRNFFNNEMFCTFWHGHSKIDNIENNNRHENNRYDDSQISMTNCW